MRLPPSFRMAIEQLTHHVSMYVKSRTRRSKRQTGTRTHARLHTRTHACMHRASVIIIFLIAPRGIIQQISSKRAHEISVSGAIYYISGLNAPRGAQSLNIPRLNHCTSSAACLRAWQPVSGALRGEQGGRYPALQPPHPGATEQEQLPVFFLTTGTPLE